MRNMTYYFDANVYNILFVTPFKIIGSTIKGIKFENNLLLYLLTYCVHAKQIQVHFKAEVAY